MEEVQVRLHLVSTATLLESNSANKSYRGPLSLRTETHFKITELAVMPSLRHSQKGINKYIDSV